MRLVASIVVGVLGAVLRFEMAAEVAGFKVHAIGVTLMIASVAGFVATQIWNGWLRSHRVLPAA